MARIILASQSPTRKGLLEKAGVPFAAVSPGVDERAVETPLIAAGRPPDAIALALAEAKALAVSRQAPDSLVIGADQTLDLDGQRGVKPETRAEAREQLLSLAGRTHRLHTGVVGMRDGEARWRLVETATLAVRPLSAADVDAYLAEVGAAALTSVGAYQIEGPGIRLFERIDGDYFTILGLPLLPVLSWLRKEGALE